MSLILQIILTIYIVCAILNVAIALPVLLDREAHEKIVEEAAKENGNNRPTRLEVFLVMIFLAPFVTFTLLFKGD
jgi:flagellar basal body-associated protein FliL